MTKVKTSNGADPSACCLLLTDCQPWTYLSDVCNNRETIFRQDPHSAQVTPSVSPSRSHSRSPPPDLTHHPAPASPQTHRPNPSSHAQQRAADESRSLSSPSSSTAGFHLEGLHVGQSRDSALVSLVKGIFALLAWPCRAIAGRRSGSALDRRQRALWTWVNVDDLDAFLSDVSTFTSAAERHLLTTSAYRFTATMLEKASIV